MKHRKSNRLQNYNYSHNGMYFVTVCTKDKQSFFGKVINNKMQLNTFGEIVKKTWINLPNHYHNCLLDEFIVMPNHFHGIIEINNNVGTGFKPVRTEQHGLSEIIRGFKTFSSREINKHLRNKKFHWQRSYYDHIIRKNQPLNKIREYIMINPQEWHKDKYNT